MVLKQTRTAKTYMHLYNLYGFKTNKNRKNLYELWSLSVAEMKKT